MFLGKVCKNRSAKDWVWFQAVDFKRYLDRDLFGTLEARKDLKGRAVYKEDGFDLDTVTRWLKDVFNLEYRANGMGIGHWGHEKLEVIADRKEEVYFRK